MSTIQNLVAGLGGAIALNVLHESLKYTGTNMPRIDLLGEEALQKGLHYFNTGIDDKDRLYYATLAGDVISNSIYYSTIGIGKSKHVWLRAIAIGLAAGVGAVALPKPMGLDPQPVARNKRVATLTVAYYLAGAIVAGGLVKILGSKK